MDIKNIFYETAVSSFVEVGTFVAIPLLILGYINFKTEGRLIDKMEKNKKIQVLLGAFLGMTPGCGGAIMVMPLYHLGKVTFGTIVATLIATMGDAAFLLLVKSPKIFAAVSIISFIVAVVTGYIIDYFGIGKNILKKPKTKYELEKEHKMFREEPTEFQLNAENKVYTFKHLGHEEGDAVDIALHHGKSMGGIFHKFRHTLGYKVFWTLIIFSFPMAVLNLLQKDLDTIFFIKDLSVLGFIGTVFSVIYTIISKKIISDENHAEVESKMNSFKETLIHNAEETAFVIMWVFIALFSYEVLVGSLGGEVIIANFMSRPGFIVVLTAVLIGIIPGCGPQIILTTLFINGVIPFSALMANAICNDGDALFPLLAIDRKSAIITTFYNVIPALIVGSILYILGL